jgi:hypothetical protein
MRFRLPTRALAAGLLGAALDAGCGKTDSGDPKPVNVKHDPRLKIAGDGGGGGNKPSQPNQGGDTGAAPQ